jgi:hypothetical protein
VAPAAKQPLSESPLASTNRVLPPLPASTGSEENPLFGFHRIEAEMEMISKMTRPPAEITQQKLSWVDNKVDVGTVVKSSRTELGERQLPEVPSSRAEIIPNHRLYSNKTVEVVTAARPNVVVLDSSRRDDRSDCSGTFTHFYFMG